MRSLLMADRPQYYVSLGDSMSIDDYSGGPGCGAASLLYRNRDEDFPEWRGRDLKTRLPGVRFVPLAANGATSATVRYAQVPRLREMGVRPSLVTLTMGGNDLLQSFGSDDAARVAHRTLRENGHTVLEAVRRTAAQDARVLVGTIYDPSDGTGDMAALGIALWPGAVEWVARFNETLRDLAAEHGALVADLRAAFLGHGLASGANPAQADARPPNRDLYYCSVIEPNAWGAAAIRSLWWECLRASGIPWAAA